MSIFKTYNLTQEYLNHCSLITRNRFKETKGNQFFSKELESIESCLVGVIGEYFIRMTLDLGIEDYFNGMIQFNSRVYDVKTDAIPELIFNKIKSGLIKSFEPYGCRVFPVSEYSRLKHEYTGGIIFACVKIPKHKSEKIKNVIREDLFLNTECLIVGYVPQKEALEAKATEFGPRNPFSDTRVKYKTKNLIFVNNNLYSLESLLNNGKMKIKDEIKNENVLKLF